MTKYSQLLAPGSIGQLTLNNRMMLAAMGSNFAESDGSCGERLLAYYEERARGGAGLLIMETATVNWPAGCSMPNMVGLSDDRFLPGLRELANRVHSHGSRIAAQLNHSGKVSQEDVIAGRPVLVPSVPVKGRSDLFALLTPEEMATFIKAAGPDGKGARYHEMTQADIDTLVQQFADSARRVQQAGFDAVEIHAGHGYVISSFLSPAVNRRSDKYGGGIENRARLLCEVITAVREATGPGFPIIVRQDAYEFRIENGIQLDDCVRTATLAEAAGADAIDVSAYGDTSKGIAFTEAPLVHKPGGFIDFAKAVKQAVRIPVIAVGRIELDRAERGLVAGEFDFVAMGRKLLADPHLPNKLKAGKASTIRPCIYCYVCVSKIFINSPMCCAVNSAMGEEYRDQLIQTDRNSANRILIIGGGPAGLEAARLLAESGAQVSLWEREKDLGGTARIAALAYEPNGRLVDYLVQAVRALPIDLQLGKTATVADIVAASPDTVLVAAGANRESPAIPGKDQRHVFDGNELRGLLFGGDAAAAAKLTGFQRLVLTLGQLSQLLRSVTALRLLSRLWLPFSRRITIIGGGLVGLELAEFLVERGRHVTVLEPGAHLGVELSIVRRARVIHELREHGAELICNAQISEITSDSVHYSLDSEHHKLPSEQVVIAMGAAPNLSLSTALATAGIETLSIGDCQEVGYIEGAIRSARQAAQSILEKSA